MDEHGKFTDDDWATIYGAGGAAPVPSYLSTHYGRPRYRPYPSAAYAWRLGTATLFLLVPVLVAVPLAIRAGIGGNRWAWVALAWSVLAAGLFFVIWPPLLT